MNWLQYLQALWPIAVVIIPIVLGGGFVWLKTQFPTKHELKTIEKELQERLDRHSKRFESGKDKFAEHDRRIAVVEEDCKRHPSRDTLQGSLSELSQRVRGVEVASEAMERQLNTANRYLEMIVDKGIKK